MIHLVLMYGEQTVKITLLRDKWRLASDKKKIKLLLNGDPHVDFQTNVNLFRCVQSFISQTNRFS